MIPSSLLLSPIYDISIALSLLILFLPFRTFILLIYSGTRVPILFIASHIYYYLSLIRDDDIFFSSTYGDNGMVIATWALWSFSQIEKTSDKFKILSQLQINNNMGLGSNNPLISCMDALECLIDADMLIWYTVWDVIGVSV